MLALAGAMAILFAIYRRRYELLAVMLAVPGGIGVNLLLKVLFHRHRPAGAIIAMYLSDPSFPSGHVIAATLFWGFCAAMCPRFIQSWRWRITCVLLAIVVVLAVAFSRLYIGAHYLSDILAAMVAGIGWLAVCLTAVATIRRSRQGRQEEARQ